MAARVAARYGSRRLFSSGSGKKLSEEEKAAENAYFKKAEQACSHGHAGTSDPTMKKDNLARKILYELLVEERSGHAGTSADRVSTDKYRNSAVVAGTVTILGALGWYLKGTVKKPEVQD